MQEKIHQYTKALLDNVTSMISDKLGTPKPEIPKSMEAPYMRLVLLPEYEGYPAGTHVSMKYWHETETQLFCFPATQLNRRHFYLVALNFVGIDLEI